MVKKECKRKRLRVKAGKTVKFENKMDGREESRMLTECWREKKKIEEKNEREREKYYQRNGYASEKKGMYYEETETIEHMWTGSNEMRKRERKERGEILNEDGRDRMDERDEERQNGKRKG
jgi:hypothetical protein